MGVKAIHKGFALNCKNIERLLGRHVDGETSVAEADQVRQHLSGCPRCEQRFGTLQKESFLLQQYYDETEVPEGLADRVLARVQQEAQQVRFQPQPRRLQWLAAVAAVLLAVLVAQWLTQPRTPEGKEGSITPIRPPVMRQLPGSETWSQLSGTGYLLPGGALDVWKGGMAHVVFPGLGAVLLNEESRIFLEEYSEGNGLTARLSQGEAFLDFAKGERAFRVHTPLGEILGNSAAANIQIISGTGASVGFGPDSPSPEIPWLVNCLPDLLPSAVAGASDFQLIVTAKTGSVRVRHEFGETEVFAGTQIVFEDGRQPKRPVTANLEKVLGWTLIRQAPAVEMSLVIPAPLTVPVPGPNTVSTATATQPTSPTPLTTTEKESEQPSQGVIAQTEKPLELLPPIIMEATPEVGKVTLKWVDDAATTYPVLGYEIYRSASEPDTESLRLNDSPIPVMTIEDATGGVFVDTTVAGDVQFTYRVTALTSQQRGEAPQPLQDRTGLLESAPSAPLQVTAMRDFVLVLTGWMEQPEPTAHILVQKWHRGRYVGQRFHVRVGDPVGHGCQVRFGGSATSPDFVETVDFSTGFTLMDLRRVRRTVPGGRELSKEQGNPMTLPTQEALLQSPSGKIIKLTRQP